MSEIRFVDGNIILWGLMGALLYLMWKITKMQSEYHEYSFQCLKCNRRYITRSRIKMFFMEIHHSFVCKWKMKLKRKYPLKLRLLWFIMSIGIRTNYISSKAHKIYNDLPTIDCDMVDTTLCIYYWKTYKEKCRYMQTHKVICLKEDTENDNC